MLSYDDYNAPATHTHGVELKKPIRDQDGKFVKGHKPLVRPKYELLKKYPKLICDTCYLGMFCSDYLSGYVCTQKRELKRFIKNREIDAVLNELYLTTDWDNLKIQWLRTQEIIGGGASTGTIKTYD